MHWQQQRRGHFNWSNSSSTQNGRKGWWARNHLRIQTTHPKEGRSLISWTVTNAWRYSWNNTEPPHPFSQLTHLRLTPSLWNSMIIPPMLPTEHVHFISCSPSWWLVGFRAAATVWAKQQNCVWERRGSGRWSKGMGWKSSAQVWGIPWAQLSLEAPCTLPSRRQRLMPYGRSMLVLTSMVVCCLDAVT